MDVTMFALMAVAFVVAVASSFVIFKNISDE